MEKKVLQVKREKIILCKRYKGKIQNVKHFVTIILEALHSVLQTDYKAFVATWAPKY